ncbi:uncharacterized protein LOC134842270 [Symsagittifera roscoffensis]|uniref:uncharacterized protein LOC134842270 n=1 Tax=Symsagittifera roscoffensis TaxID=84072 RepID=UPI00307B28A3
MKSTFSKLIIFASLQLCAQAGGNVATPPSCVEECPPGFEQVAGLPHCYKLMLALGPVSHDKAVVACGFEGGATLATFDTVGDQQTLRNHMWSHYGAAIAKDPAHLAELGFWTGYARQYGDSSNSFVNIYSGQTLDSEFFANGQPDNLLLGVWGEEACVVRKKFSKSVVKWANSDTGLDDYNCAFPHWAICMHRDVFALNMQAYNSVLMAGTGVNLPVGGSCRVDWVDQNVYILDMISAKREANGYADQAQQFAGIVNEIRSPTCPTL